MNIREAIFFTISEILAFVTKFRVFQWVYQKYIAFINLFTPPLKNTISKSWILGLFVWCTSIFFMFGVNVLWSYKNDRLFSITGDGLYNFFEDKPNLWSFILICPGYVTFSILFLVHLGRFYTTGIMSQKLRYSPNRKAVGIVLLALFSLSISFISVSYYATEFLSYSKFYWCKIEITSSIYIFNQHGYYYLFLNLLLNLIVMITGFYGLKMWDMAYTVEAELKGWEDKNGILKELCEKKIKDKLVDFSTAYVCFKLFLLFLYLNIFTWFYNEPRGSQMLLVSASALALGILVLVSIPKYHVQYWIHRAFKTEDKDLYFDIRTIQQKRTCILVDLVIIGGTIFNFIGLRLPEFRSILDPLLMGKE